MPNRELRSRSLRYLRRFALAVLAATACTRGEKPAADSALAEARTTQDSALNREMLDFALAREESAAAAARRGVGAPGAARPSVGAPALGAQTPKSAVATARPAVPARAMPSAPIPSVRAPLPRAPSRVAAPSAAPAIARNQRPPRAEAATGAPTRSEARGEADPSPSLTTHPPPSRPATSVARGAPTESPPARRSLPDSLLYDSTLAVARSPADSIVRGVPGARYGTITAGSALVLASSSRVCTNTHRVGDTFTATVQQPVSGTDGAVVPAGATAIVVLTKVKRSENITDPIQMGFQLRSLYFGGRSYAVSSDVTSADIARVRNQSVGSDAEKVVGGAIVGAIAGQAIGRNTKSTVIGAATGAAAGAAAAVATANYEGCLNPGARLTAPLDRTISVRLASAER